MHETEAGHLKSCFFKKNARQDIEMKHSKSYMKHGSAAKTTSKRLE